MKNDPTTKASHPKTAVFQWFALQRPIRAAKLFEHGRSGVPQRSSGGVGPRASVWMIRVFTATPLTEEQVASDARTRPAGGEDGVPVK